MPAEKFTKKARTAKQKRQWQHVYDSELSRGASEGEAITRASGVIKKGSQGRKGRRAKRR